MVDVLENRIRRESRNQWYYFAVGFFLTYKFSSNLFCEYLFGY